MDSSVCKHRRVGSNLKCSENGWSMSLNRCPPRASKHVFKCIVTYRGPLCAGRQRVNYFRCLISRKTSTILALDSSSHQLGQCHLMVSRPIDDGYSPLFSIRMMIASRKKSSGNSAGPQLEIHLPIFRTGKHLCETGNYSSKERQLYLNETVSLAQYATQNHLNPQCSHFWAARTSNLTSLHVLMI
jgi:hypothetical protein